MLPIGRTISVGGVLLAFMVVALALSSRGGAHSYFMRPQAPARGPLLDRHNHPEWRQLLIRAAFRRAEALQELQARPEPPMRPLPASTKSQPPQPPAKKLATLPHARAGTATPDTTGTIPVDIGESSSTELPVLPHEEKPPAITVPQLKPRESSVPEPTPQPPTRKAKQEAKPDKPAPQAQAHRTKPHARRPHRRARRHGRTARRSRRSARAAKPAQYNLFQLFDAPAPKGRQATLPDRNAARY